MGFAMSLRPTHRSTRSHAASLAQGICKQVTGEGSEPTSLRQMFLLDAREALQRVLESQRLTLRCAATDRAHDERPATAGVARAAPASCAAIRASTSRAIPV